MNSTFFVIGGTLGRDTPSYVPRAADERLFGALARGEYCYVLTSRQMGKSSLMVRTASRLREHGVTVAVLDLTSLGVNLTPEQWYDGLLARIGRQLDREDEVEKAWLDDARAGAGPLERWLHAMETTVLGTGDERIVIFIDEIDVVRSLPFSADEFFAAIRHCYNRRATEGPWQRLTFCLLGVATPSDLISDARMTSFNVGQRIELNDFRFEEAALLAEGLGGSSEHSRQLLARVFGWTGGHPYLTQRLCWEVAANPDVRTPRDVDRLCRRVFLSADAQERDDNLAFVRHRIVRSDDVAGLLDLYQRVRRGERVAVENNPLAESLNLSGITRVEDGQLRVRNRIYGDVFDLPWVRRNMPDAERRRQRRAYYLGLLRAGLAATAVILMLAIAWAVAYRQWRLAESALTGEQEQRRLAQQREAEAIRLRGEEAKQRAFAEQQRQAAEELRRAAEQQRQRADEQRQLAIQQQQAAEEQRQLAEERQREAIELRKQEQRLRQVAEQQTRTAEEKQAEAVEALRRMRIAYQQLTDEQRSSAERAKLFAAIPVWLQAYSAEAVAQHARRQIAQGEWRAALQTYAEFCDLALIDSEGFWVRELVRLGSDQLASAKVDATLLDSRITVSPSDVYRKVIEPGIQLGEQHVSGAAEEVRRLVASLYGSRGRLAFQHRGEKEFPGGLAEAVSSFQRAIELSPRHDYHAGRAIATFWLKDRNLAKVRTDLEAALAQYPTRVESPATPAAVSRPHREISLLHHSVGNVAELLAEAGDPSAGAEMRGLLELAGKQHQAARAAHPFDVRYAVAVGRVCRKRAVLTGDEAGRKQLLAESLSEFRDAELLDDTYPQLHNERGELRLVTGDIAAARVDFDKAVRFGKARDSVENRFRYLCNQANANWRTPSTVTELRTALAAADEALALDVADKSEAHYYRGLALWSLANAEANAVSKPNGLREALAALARAPTHLGAMLAHSQIVFDFPELRPTAEQLRQAMQAAQRAVGLARHRSDRAKAHYVVALGHFREHVTSRAEPALVSALEELLQSTRESSDYSGLAAEIYRYAKQRTWRDAELGKRAQMLIKTFEEKGLGS